METEYYKSKSGYYLFRIYPYMGRFYKGIIYGKTKSSGYVFIFITSGWSMKEKAINEAQSLAGVSEKITREEFEKEFEVNRAPATIE